MAAATGRDQSMQTMLYDPASHTKSATDTPAGGVATPTNATFYLNGAVRSVSELNTTQTYSYDGAGAEAIRQDTTPAGALTTSYSYSDNEQPASISGGVTATAITLAYDDQARVTNMSYGSGPTLSRTWNADDTLASQSLNDSSNASWNYAYDGLYRMLAADSNNTSTDCATGQTITSVTPSQGCNALAMTPPADSPASATRMLHGQRLTIMTATG